MNDVRGAVSELVALHPSGVVAPEQPQLQLSPLYWSTAGGQQDGYLSQSTPFCAATHP